MVLEGLGGSLRGALKRIANAPYIDSKLIKEVNREVQRALIQSDVNVKLVLSLTKKIEKRTLEEKPPLGMSNREHVIRIVHDELTKILGKKREIPLKRQMIMMVGLYGQGKCVHPDADVILASGEIIKSKELYSNYKNVCEEETIDDGNIIDVHDRELYAPSFNPRTLKIENKKVTHLWKLKGKGMLKVYLDAGNDFSVGVTPEHPFFIIRRGKFLKARADELNLNDFIAVPREYPVNTKKYDLFDDLKKLDLYVYLDPKFVKSRVHSKFNTIKEMMEKLNFKRNYSKFTVALKNGRIPISLVDGDIAKDSFKMRLFNSRKVVRFPRFLTNELAEFIGYFVGDGHLAEGYIEIVNSDLEIIERIKDISRKLFRIEPTIKKDGRRENLYKIIITSKTLVEIFKNVFDFKPGKKGLDLKIPPCLLTSPNEVAADFIRAYFDCDGSIYKDYRNIEITSESECLIEQINLLLRRFGIFSCKSIKYVNDKTYWKLSIQSRYAEIFCKKIGSLIERKKLRLSNFYKMGQGCGKHDMIQLGNVLKNLRESLGFSIGRIQRSVSSYGLYEKNGRISREALSKLCDFYGKEGHGKMLDILESIREGRNFSKKYERSVLNAVLSRFKSICLLSENDGNIRLTRKGDAYIDKSKRFDKDNNMTFIKNLANSDICWIKVKKIENSSAPQFVYDLTVEDNHNFIADGVIVHNTTTCGKLAWYFKKKGMRPALIAADIHRPAAYDQLKQIGDEIGVPVHGDNGKAVAVVKGGMNKFRKQDVLIVDTSGRHKLEKDLIKEMKQIFAACKPDEKILVMDASMGQGAGAQAKAFDEAIGITGVILTKMDGTAKGGGALSAVAEIGSPILYIGTGEHIDEFEKFDPTRFISRLLGMGDIQSLLEKAEEAAKGKEMEKTAKKLMSGRFTLKEMYDQMETVSKMGPLRKIVDMLPGGMGSKLRDADVDMESTQKKLGRFRVMMDSMTEEEMDNPRIIKASRIKRISRGSGVEAREVKELLRYYNMSKKMMKGLSSRNQRQLMKRLKFT